jgi:tetraprenyl-beta-curcumene synthase
MRIPDKRLRHDAVDGLDHKRPHIYGSALFCTVPQARSPDLLRLLVAYNILGDFLDTVHERGAHAGLRNGMQLQSALIEALDPSLPISDHYRYHPWTDDGGYMRALIDACRHGFVSLPSHETITPLLAVHGAEMVTALVLNHEPQTVERVAVLQAWAEANPLEGVDLNWFERTASASSWVPVLPLLALAAEPGLSEQDAASTIAAYMPWVSVASALLDSYADFEDDRASGAHSYVAYYETDELMAERLAEIVTNSLRGVASIRDGSRHLVIVGCMIAMYLSKDRQRTSANKARTATIVSAGGPLVEVLMPIVRAWRRLYGLRAS